MSPGPHRAIESPLVLNLGAGEDGYGDVRVDIARSSTCTLVCDVEKGFPFRDAVFTEVYTRCLFEHLRNPGHFLDEAFRVLRPGGTLELVTDHAGYWRWHLQIDHARGYTHRTSEDRHYSLFSPGHLVNHCEAAGFRVKAVGFDSFGPSVRLGKDRILGKIPPLRVIAAPRLRIVAVKADELVPV